MPIAAWSKRILWIDLSGRTYSLLRYDGAIARDFVGGRGLAAKILWDHLDAGTEPLGPHNLLVVAVGPLTGVSGVSSAKLVVASKSPLTGGYGDGSLSSRAALCMKSLGLDAVVVTGASQKPVYVVLRRGPKVDFEGAEHLWRLTTWRSEELLRKAHGKKAGILVIGPAGENLVYYATIISERSRSGGRPGLGAVMGAKKLKAIVFECDEEEVGLRVSEPEKVKSIILEAAEKIMSSPQYSEWIRMGTLSTLKWAQENSVLPSHNFREGIFEEFEKLWRDVKAKLRSSRGCPLCCMPCGHSVIDSEGVESELDYEGVAMLGPNVGLSRLEEIAALARMADEYGLDVISLGNVLGHLIEAHEKGLLRVSDYDLDWGNYRGLRRVLEDIVFKRGLGLLASKGVMRISKALGSEELAVHVKGLEVSAYDCHAAPAMALAYATSPIGAHHKDAWIIAWEIKYGRTKYDETKVLKVIELQRIRGGFFEVVSVCRFPWVELGLPLDYYIKLFHAVTGIKMSLEDFYVVADRVYALMRLFWVRELGSWSSEMDMPPIKWFKHRLQKGPLRGVKLDFELYKVMLNTYYEIRGWNSRGIPTRETLRRLGLENAISELEEFSS